MNKALCLIPAKGCSTRLTRKNLLPLNGMPMVARAIQKALKTGIFDTVCVSTEDAEIASVSTEYGAEVPFIRPMQLAKDPSTIIDVMLHALEYYTEHGQMFEKICTILPTAPFTTIKDIQQANHCFDQTPDHALLSVCPTEYPPFNTWRITGEKTDQFLSPCFPDSPYRYTKSTECPDTYRSNGAILITGTRQLIKDKTYRNKPIQPYIMPLERSLDIDTPFEYELAKFISLNISNNSIGNL